ncbi:MAG: tyrosine-type recombinase/integrase [Fimbriimonadaceae bacterium]|jgi:integrase|nr:tyrosine-type recombinase/integrase [Fimbriimonadaceae bacterium]
MASRSDHREGSCRQIITGRLSGKWRVQFTLEVESGVKKRISRIFPTQKEGKDFLRSLKRSDQVAAIVKAKEKTFGEWFMWLAEHDWPESLDPKTIRDRVSRYKKYAASRWAGIPLTKIDPIDVKAFYKKLADDGVGEHTRIALKAGLVRAFNQAISPYRQVPYFWSNPFCLDMPAPERRKAVALTPDEARKALAAPKLDDGRRAMLGVFLLAGLRLGEQMALTRGQLDMENGLILIDRAVKLDEKSAQEVGLPKGGKVRHAVMCDTLKGLLEPVIEGLEANDYLWPQASENKPRMKTLVYATWRRIRTEAGLPGDMSPHDCRLTHINWIEKLCPEVSATTLKEHVGHSAEGVTEVNYTRPISPSQANLRSALDRLIEIAEKD